jgi:hypothetical protein
MVGNCDKGEALSRPQTAFINNNDNISNNQRDKQKYYTVKMTNTVCSHEQKPPIFFSDVHMKFSRSQLDLGLGTLSTYRPKFDFCNKCKGCMSVEFLRELGGLEHSSSEEAHQCTFTTPDYAGRRTFIKPEHRRILSTIAQFREIEENGAVWVEQPHFVVRDARIAFYDMSSWYPMVAEHTFHSVLIALDGEASAERVDDAIARVGGDAFFKLSSVSPKDLCHNAPGERPSYAALRVRNAAAVFELLERSRRLHNSRAFNRGTSLVLREWIDGLDSRFEFRCFVFDARVTAISQYDWTTPYAIWSDDDHCHRTKAAIVAFVQAQIVPRIASHCREWVVDVVFHRQRWFVVEINMFGADLNVGGCLFHWAIDYDVIHATAGEPVMRVLSDGSVEAGFFVVKQL